ncbi:unnamed protein product [Hydatigera taeniaeformis]|uniref:OBG-type G domain-containing protein n=1 Tax=Hydatigena taeniaeformis TaxID=6205 RepID=A0A0R3WM21_HYDTA|nr:unnamed protein product [Hydatigera taeniaeformis]
MGILDKIAEVEREIARTQKNKATEYHLGLLKAKLAKYRAELLKPVDKSQKGEGFDVLKSGDARVVLIGFPSVGKSTLLNALTSANSECAAYEFTTLTCVPGVIEYEGAKIQLLDLPGIVEGAAQGKGRGRQVIAVARTADLVLMMIDATKPLIQRELLEKELESVGIRLNQRKPNVYFKVLSKEGWRNANQLNVFTYTYQREDGADDFTRVQYPFDIPYGYALMQHYSLASVEIFNADVVIREDITQDQLIDVIVGNRVYLKCIYVYNKIDQISLEEVDKLAREPHSVVISCNLNLNLDYLLKVLWKYLDLIQIYTKKQGQKPDLDEGIILRNGATIEHVCHCIHRSLASNFKYALVWGTSVKFSPQRVGLSHVVNHHDVIQIVKK